MWLNKDTMNSTVFDYTHGCSPLALLAISVMGFTVYKVHPVSSDAQAECMPDLVPHLQ